jgi:hypothetical protein
MTSTAYTNAPIFEASLEFLTQITAFSEPKTCILNVLGAFATLVEDPDAVLANDTGYAQRKDRVLTLCSRWICLRRTPTEIKNILSSTCRCSVLQAPHKLHEFGSRATIGAAGTPGQMLVYICTLGLCKLHIHMNDFTTFKLHHLSSRQQWPYDTNQITPHGAEATVSGYLDWLASDDLNSLVRVMQSLTAVAQYGWPLIVPAIIRKRLFLDQFIKFSFHWLNVTKELMNGDQDALKQVHPMRISNLLIPFLVLMRIICAECSDPVAAAYYLRPQHLNVAKSCDRMLSAVTLVHQRVQTEQSQNFCDRALYDIHAILEVICYSFPDCAKHTVGLGVHKIITDFSKPLENSRLTLWRTLVDILQYHYTRQSCAAPGCDRTTEGTGRPFRYCTGCLWVPYCSRRCQKNAWRRADRVQHRDICPLIRRLRSEIRVPHVSQLRYAMKDIPMLSQNNILMIQDIIAHFTALTMHGIENK